MGSNVGGSNFSTPLAGLFEEGKKGDTVSQKSNSSSISGVTLKAASDLEKSATGQIGSSFGQLQDMLNRGPGNEAVDASNKEQQSYVDMMRQINSTGGMPTAEDTRRANILADELFAPQQEAAKQAYGFAQQDAAKLAAKLNRPINDPIIQAKLQQEQMRQSSLMSADRTAFVAGEARNSPFQRLQMQGQLADAQGSLASQAMSNRMQLLNLGNSLQQQERNWRLQTSEKYGASSGTQEQHSGGGAMGGIGAITGAMGQFTNLGTSVVSAFMGGGGQTQQPEKAQANFGGQPSAQIANFGGYNSSGGQMNDIQSAYMGSRGSSVMSPQRASRLSGGGGGSKGPISGVNGGFSMAGMFSDKRLKKDIKSVSKQDLAELKSTIKPYTWQYTEQENGSGEWTGVMAQDLQKSKLGRSVLFEDHRGMLAIDMRKLTSLLLATLAEAS